MANITELQLQGSSTIHKLNDARITTTAVSTATHFLATDSSISSIAPITTANLASVLGALTQKGDISVDGTDLNDYATMGEWAINAYNLTNAPDQRQGGWFSGNLIVINGGTAQGGYPLIQIITKSSEMWFRNKWVSTWSQWVKVSTDIPSFYNDYSTLTELKAALDAL